MTRSLGGPQELKVPQTTSTLNQTAWPARLQKNKQRATVCACKQPEKFSLGKKNVHLPKTSRNEESFQTEFAFVLTQCFFLFHAKPRRFSRSRKREARQLPLACDSQGIMGAQSTQSASSTRTLIRIQELHLDAGATRGFIHLLLLIWLFSEGTAGAERACLSVGGEFCMQGDRSATQSLIDLWQENALLIRHCFISGRCRVSRLGLAGFNGWESGGEEMREEGNGAWFFNSSFLHSSHQRQGSNIKLNLKCGILLLLTLCQF